MRPRDTHCEKKEKDGKRRLRKRRTSAAPVRESNATDAAASPHSIVASDDTYSDN